MSDAHHKHQSHPKRHKRKLTPKGRHATKQAVALSHTLHTRLSAPDASGRVDIASAAKHMRATLRSLRRPLARAHHREAQAAARGLADLQISVTKLAQATNHPNPEKASLLLYSGFKALERAQHQARKAGDAWPL